MTCAKIGTSFGVRLTMVGSPLESGERQREKLAFGISNID